MAEKRMGNRTEPWLPDQISDEQLDNASGGGERASIGSGGAGREPVEVEKEVDMTSVPLIQVVGDTEESFKQEE